MNVTNIDISEPSLSRSIKFYLFLSLEIPSVFLSIYILYKMFSNRKFSQRINNHSIIGLILLSFIETTTELPIALDYLRLGYIQIQTNQFCLFWIWYNFSLQTTNLSLMLWTSIERHIFIFHSNVFRTQRGKWKYHYIPLIISIIYIPIFYFLCIFVYQCENDFNYFILLCGNVCYNNIRWLSTFDWLTNMLIPSILIPLLTFILLIRFLIQKKKMKQTFKWYLTRKLIIQFMIISILYLTFWTPLGLISLIRIYFLPTFLDQFTFYYLYYTPYLVQLLIPFVCFVCLPEIWPKKNNRIYPIQN